MIICSICLSLSGKRGYKTVCGHKFHTKCILQWLLNNDNCPICRGMLRNIPDESEEVEDPLTDIELSRLRSIFFLVTNLILRRRSSEPY